MRKISADSRNVLLLALLVAVSFGDVASGVRGFYKEDVFGYHFPMKKVVRDLSFSGSFPYWDPSIHAGQPLAANPAYELFYPPQWLIYLPSFVYGFQLHILFHILMAVVGMYLFLRSLGSGQIAAAFGAISFGLGGPYLSLTVRLPFLFALAWLPLILLFARRFIRHPNRRDFAWAALLIGMQALLAEPTTALQTFLIIGLFALWKVGIREERRRIIPTLCGVLALFVSGLLVAAVQLGPAFDHARDSVRGAGFEWRVASNWSTPPVRLAEVAYPQLFRALPGRDGTQQLRSLYPYRLAPFLTDVYVGVLAVVLALTGFVVGIRGRAYLLTLITVSLLLAFGDHTLLFRLLYDLKLFRSIRYPEKFLLTAIFALIVAAALALDRLLAGEKRVRKTAMVMVMAWLVIGFIVALSSRTNTVLPADDVSPLPWARYWGMNALRGIAAIGLMSFAPKKKLAAMAILVFALADLAFLHLAAASRAPREFFDEPEIASTLPKNRADYRIFHKAAWDEWEGTVPADLRPSESPELFSRNALYPFRAVAFGFRGALEADVDQTALLSTTRYLTAAQNSKWPAFFLSAANITQVAEFTRNEGTIVSFRQRQDPAPRYSFATRLVPLTADTDLQNGLPGDAFVAGKPFEVTAGRVTTIEESPNSVHLTVETTGGFLVAANSIHKYWGVTVDGKRAQLEEVNVAFQGVTVPAGKHDIEFRYRNPLLLPFGMVSILAVMALIVVGVRR